MDENNTAGPSNMAEDTVAIEALNEIRKIAEKHFFNKTEEGNETGALGMLSNIKLMTEIFLEDKFAMTSDAVNRQSTTAAHEHGEDSVTPVKIETAAAECNPDVAEQPTFGRRKRRCEKSLNRPKRRKSNPTKLKVTAKRSTQSQFCNEVETLPLTDDMLQTKSTRQNSYEITIDETLQNIPRKIETTIITSPGNGHQRVKDGDDSDDEDWSISQLTALDKKTQRRKDKAVVKLEEKKALEKSQHLGRKKLFSCEKCPGEFVSLVSYEKHQRRHLGIRERKCDVCTAAFSRLNSYRAHLSTHDGTQALKCAVCGVGCAYEKHLAAHIHLAHGGADPGEMSPDEDERPHICLVCNMGFRDKNGLRNHADTHADERKHKCDQCGELFRTSGTLAGHKFSHTDHRPHMCDICGSSFKRRHGLQVHRLTHTDVKEFTCNFCGNAFQRREQLKNHLERHQGTKRAMCPICGKGYSDQRSLRRHMMTHTGEKPHECEKCGKRFIQPGTLKLHLNTHSGDKPYACDLCEMGFAQSITLVQHKKRIHGVLSKPLKVKVIEGLDEVNVDEVVRLNNTVTEVCVNIPRELVKNDDESCVETVPSVSPQTPDVRDLEVLVMKPDPRQNGSKMDTDIGKLQAAYDGTDAADDNLPINAYDGPGDDDDDLYVNEEQMISDVTGDDSRFIDPSVHPNIIKTV